MGYIHNDPTVMGSDGYGFGGGGLLGVLIAASLFGNRRGGGLFGGGDCGGDGAGVLADAVAAKVVDLQNTGDLKAEVCGIGSEIQAQTNVQTVQFNNVREAIAGAAAEATKSAFESRIASL